MKGNHFITTVRWLAVLPVAFVAGWFVSRVAFAVMTNTGLDLRGPGYPAFLFPLLQLFPNGIAFTAVGALVAPSRRMTTATTLAVLCILMSLLIHVLLPSNVGLTNHMHFLGASLGAVIGIAVVFKLSLTQVSSDDDL
jgi:hypothetical protein